MPLPRSSRTVSRPLALFLAVASTGLAVIMPKVALAEDVYYLGGGFTGNWSNGATWIGAVPPVTNDNLIFRGALRPTSKIDERTKYGDLKFIPDGTGVSGPYTITGSAGTSSELSDPGIWDSKFASISNTTTSYQNIAAAVANSTRILTIDNSTGRSNAGAIEINTIALVPADVIGGTTDRNLTATLKPGVNGIIVHNLTTIANGQRGLVTIDGPGYVSLDNATLMTDYHVIRGTLSLFTPSDKGPRNDEPRITLEAGTTLDFDSPPSISSGTDFYVSAPSGRAALNVDSGLNIKLLYTYLSGSLAKTGAGVLEAPEKMAAGTDIAVQAGRFIMSSYFPTQLSGLSVAAGTTFDARNTDVSTPTLAGSGTVALTDVSLTLKPTVAIQVNTLLSGSGRLILDAAGGSADVRTVNNYTGGTTINAGTLIVSSAFGGLGSGDVTVNGGTLAGTGRVSGNVFVKHGGTIAPSRADTPGLNTGTFTVAGLDLTAGGNVAIEFNGINQGTQVDLLAVNNGGAFGDANITNGTLSLSRGSNFFPASGKFPKVSILKTGTSGSLAGVFARVNGVRVNDSYSFAVTYDAQNVYAQLADVSDTNLDNVQNYLDVYALASGYKTGVANQVWLSGDLSGDGLVNYTDLLLANSYVPRLTQAQFDALLPRSYALWYDYGVLQGYSVPEPTSLAVVSLAGLLLGRRRRAAPGV